MNSMDKEKFLKVFNNSQDASIIYNKLNKAINENICVNSQVFFNKNIYKKLSSKYQDIKIVLNGYEKKQIYFIPQNYENYFNYNLLKISVNNKFRKLTHKDFLGSIMSLGIQRNQIGDIFVNKNTAIVICNEISQKIILDSLEDVAYNNCKVEIIDDFDYEQYKPEYKEILITSSSLRVDSILKHLCNTSREKAKNIIDSKRLKIDHEIVLTNDKTVEIDNIFSIRGIGKFIIKDINITNKSKYRINILQYL